MNTDIIIMKYEIIITDKNGNKIEINTYTPEVIETWV